MPFQNKLKIFKILSAFKLDISFYFRKSMFLDLIMENLKFYYFKNILNF